MHPDFPFRISQVVAAADGNLAIGQNGQLLWHLPEDMRFFKNITWGMPIIMGRKTFAGLNKPLPGRTNIILTRSAQPSNGAIQYATGIKDALQIAETLLTEEVFVIGGGEVYNMFLPFTDRIYLTRVFVDRNDADTFFPAIDESDWELVHVHPKAADDRNAYGMQFETWERRK